MVKVRTFNKAQKELVDRLHVGPGQFRNWLIFIWVIQLAHRIHRGRDRAKQILFEHGDHMAVHLVGIVESVADNELNKFLKRDALDLLAPDVLRGVVEIEDDVALIDFLVEERDLLLGRNFIKVPKRPSSMEFPPDDSPFVCVGELGVGVTGVVFRSDVCTGSLITIWGDPAETVPPELSAGTGSTTAGGGVDGDAFWPNWATAAASVGACVCAASPGSFCSNCSSAGGADSASVTGKSTKSFFDEFGEFDFKEELALDGFNGACFFCVSFSFWAASFCSFFSLRFDSDSDLLRVSLFLKPFIILAARCVVLGQRPIRRGVKSLGFCRRSYVSPRNGVWVLPGG